MLDPTKWLTISLSTEQIRAGVELAIEDRILEILKPLGFPPGLVFYIRQPKLDQSSFPVVLSLPPATAAVCQDVRRDYPWVECDAPNLSEFAVFPTDN